VSRVTELGCKPIAQFFIKRPESGHLSDGWGQDFDTVGVCIDFINWWSIALLPKINYSVVMSNIKFEWDAKKASANEKKHGVSFDEARTVFFDENAKLIDDPDHSTDEERFVLLGLSSSLKLLLVCHCYRQDGNVIRIISARKASTQESKQYH